jgi:hypothetical protein
MATKRDPYQDQDTASPEDQGPQLNAAPRRSRDRLRRIRQVKGCCAVRRACASLLLETAEGTNTSGAED